MKIGTWAILPLLWAATCAGADCVVPQPIRDLPDGASAGHATMAAAHRRVWNYVEEAERYLACLDREGGAGAVSPELRQQRIRAYNATVASVREIVAQLRREIERFNEQR